jgi:AraC family transcriptional regulator of adaptative response / DNA-3-methyladenine glycosylase II
MTAIRDRETYYRAMLSRDRRFDGRFFAGVTSTGVYCRPICPAPKPKFENVQFYTTAAGAECAGFRPCKRCRPDASPGTPDWSGTSATVSLALQSIGSGFLDDHSVGELGDRLGVGERQLRRLFHDHLGASPLAVALTRRLDFARKLIDETGLSMTDVAFASGFESIRRFNDAVKKRFGESPSELRAASCTPGSGNGSGNRLVLQLPFRPPMEWDALLGYLEARRTRGVEVIENNSYCRSIRPGKNRGLILVSPAEGKACLELTVQTGSTDRLMGIVQRVRRIFDLGADPLFIDTHLSKDPGLSSVISTFPGLRIPGCWDNFELAVRTVIGQQVSISAANTIMARLVQRFGTPVDNPAVSGITHLFPLPPVLAGADLTGIGLPGKRAAALSILAAKVANKEIVLEGAVNTGELKRRLLEIPGIGQWTVEYIAMRALREPDAFPGSDMALKRELLELDRRISEQPVRMSTKRPDLWRPWRAYAAMYLWKRYAENEKKGD